VRDGLFAVTICGAAICSDAHTYSDSDANAYADAYSGANSNADSGSDADTIPSSTGTGFFCRA
jgi:hypothetical protein